MKKYSLKDLRRNKKMSQIKFSEKLAVSVVTVRKWERNEAIPSIQDMFQIAEILEVPSDDILEMFKISQTQVEKNNKEEIEIYEKFTNLFWETKDFDKFEKFFCILSKININGLVYSKNHMFPFTKIIAYYDKSGVIILDDDKNQIVFTKNNFISIRPLSVNYDVYMFEITLSYSIFPVDDKKSSDLSGFKFLFIGGRETMYNIGEAIKQYRHQNHLTQEQFGKKVGVNKQTVSKWENGALQVSTNKYFEIEQIIGNLISQETPIIYKKIVKYNVGLNLLFNNICDYKSLVIFLDSFIVAHNLLVPLSSFGILKINITNDDESDDDLIIESIKLLADYILIETTYYQLKISKEMFEYIKGEVNFNNEVYKIICFKENQEFIQIVVGFRGDKKE